MSLINELRVKSYNAENAKQEVIAEIKGYFDKYFEGDGLEQYLRVWIHSGHIEQRQVNLGVSFWEHHDGCSGTNFSCGGGRWMNPDPKSWRYKGVELRTIDNDVCDYLLTKLIAKMRELGFHFVSENDCRSRFGYYDKSVYFGW